MKLKKKKHRKEKMQTNKKTLADEMFDNAKMIIRSQAGGPSL